MDPAVGTIVAQIGLILIPSLLFVWLTRQPFKEIFKLKRLSFGSGTKCFLIGLACWAVFVFLGTLAQGLRVLISPARAGSPTDIATGGGAPWLVFLGMALVAPLCEEALNRGVLLSAYEKRVGVHAIWLVGILFAFLHPSLEQILGALFVGTVAGWVVYRTRSIWAGVLVHMGTNLWSFAALMVVVMAYFVYRLSQGAL
jgi:membrane protease YdiL (CAAX protease family)